MHKIITLKILLYNPLFFFLYMKESNHKRGMHVSFTQFFFLKKKL